MKPESTFRVVITGPESTGKSTLSAQLAQRTGGTWVPEYARTYIESLQRPYTREDVETIARHQISEMRELERQSGLIIFDTWLILTKVWLEVVYGDSPGWLSDAIRSSQVDLFLLCVPDLPWVPDPVRENGGEMRNVLFNRYAAEISRYGFKWVFVQGEGEARIQNAMNALRMHGII